MENIWVSRKQLKEDMKVGLIYAESSVKCKTCGHAMLLAGRDRRVCSWCGNYIYKDDKTEFKYKLKEKILKERII